MPALQMWQLECSLFVDPTNGSNALSGRRIDSTSRTNRPQEPALNTRKTQ
jgi:hypothetical protein